MKANSVKSETYSIKIMKSIRCILILLFVLLYVQNTLCQEEKPEKKDRKNTVKVNLTSPLIFGNNNFIIGYERTVGKHQSIAVNGGSFSIGRIFDFDIDSIQGFNKEVSSRGVSLSGDYRFYLAKENRYNSPHGLYIGPYFAYNYFDRKFELEANTAAFTGSLNADFSFRVATLGFQLGYQFVFWDRVSLDLILFGPGVSSYKVKADLNTSLDPDKEAEVFQKINEKLQEKIPGYNLVIEPGSFERSGSTNTTSFGYRYIVMAGFRF
jgi:hypothetical protein